VSTHYPISRTEENILEMDEIREPINTTAKEPRISDLLETRDVENPIENLPTEGYTLVIVDLPNTYYSSPDYDPKNPDGFWHDYGEILTIEDIIDKTIENDMPIFTIETPETGWITPEPFKSKLDDYSENKFLNKSANSGFSNPDLEQYLIEAGHKNLIIVGAFEAFCVYATIVDALNRGFEVFSSDETSLASGMISDIKTIQGTIIRDLTSTKDFDRIMDLIDQTRNNLPY